ncbi:hemolysin D [Rhodomicrobium udaipurense JA643]|uniref:Efflux RND transporter periplasmic adaptor subunit n=1 Tax=Rhodomicrobium udaipurense TaxID=1202716 RepID=A0A8I1KJI5_9HYPH|nr:efflux RND transporter periplasmic adaptor subunit [Rhodomicrobium udaipurense]KAI94639.1 hemolysin D [Rhodomicrobium udaipurense JA643]MBJ7542966.1 efflux RND transporter periplasmic adaptor subunit [Rhodomicrobium udaipurense]
MTFRLRKTRRLLWALLPIVSALAAPEGAEAQAPGAGPPAVGVVRVEEQPLTQTSEFLGRIQATDRVNIVARVSGFLEKRFFEEGSEVKKGESLYRIEQPPFKAEVDARRAVVDQLKAQLENAKLTLDRAKSLLGGPAGQQSAYDSALAQQRSFAAQVLGAQAQLQTAEINLGYTDIVAPITGKIGRTAITEGNYVTPSSGTLTTIVSQDPMYVVFPVAVRAVNELVARYATRGGFEAVRIKLRLPDGRIYEKEGEVNFVDNTVSTDTDTIILRGTIPNPQLTISKGVAIRTLSDGEFVRVILEGVQPVQAVAVPRAAVLTDQQGDYVFVIGADNKAELRRIELGQTTGATAFVLKGLTKGENIVVEGLQRVKPGQPVLPGPPAPQPGAQSNAAQPTSANGAPAAPATKKPDDGKR